MSKILSCDIFLENFVESWIQIEFPWEGKFQIKTWIWFFQAKIDIDLIYETLLSLFGCDPMREMALNWGDLIWLRNQLEVMIYLQKAIEDLPESVFHIQFFHPKFKSSVESTTKGSFFNRKLKRKIQFGWKSILFELTFLQQYENHSINMLEISQKLRSIHWKI